jgi:hypothetical protein
MTTASSSSKVLMGLLWQGEYGRGRTHNMSQPVDIVGYIDDHITHFGCISIVQVMSS